MENPTWWDVDFPEIIENIHNDTAQGVLDIRAPGREYATSLAKYLQEQDADRSIGNIIRVINFSIRSPQTWLGKYHDAPETVAAIIRHCRNVQEVSFFGDPIKERGEMDALKASPKLQKMQWRLSRLRDLNQADIIECHEGWSDMRSVQITGGDSQYISAATLRAIIKTAPKLEALYVTYADFDEDCLRALPQTMKKLVLCTASLADVRVDDKAKDRVNLSGKAIQEALERVVEMEIYAVTEVHLSTPDEKIQLRFKTGNVAVVATIDRDWGGLC
jgi:hypothetical protein